MHHPCCPFLQPYDVAVVPSGLQFFLLEFAIGDSLQQCEYRDDQAVHVVPQVPPSYTRSSRSSHKESKVDCSPFKNNGGIKASYTAILYVTVSAKTLHVSVQI